MKRIHDQWESYLSAVMPANAEPTQIQETRRAFYAGAQAFFSIQIGLLGPGQEPTDADLEMAEDLVIELQEFAELVKMGKR